MKRYSEDLCDLNDEYYDEAGPCVTIPLQESTVDKNAVVNALLPHEDGIISSQPVIYHIDVAPMVSLQSTILILRLILSKATYNFSHFTSNSVIENVDYISLD